MKTRVAISLAGDVLRSRLLSNPIRAMISWVCSPWESLEISWGQSTSQHEVRHESTNQERGKRAHLCVGRCLSVCLSVLRRRRAQTVSSKVTRHYTTLLYYYYLIRSVQILIIFTIIFLAVLVSFDPNGISKGIAVRVVQCLQSCFNDDKFSPFFYPVD